MTPAEAAIEAARHRGWIVLPWLLGVIFVLVFLQNAWVVDEAYVTFRIVDNLLEGRGLTWNPGERVQGYTHPLWMLVTAAVALVTREYYFTTLAVSLVCGVLTLVVAHRLLRSRFPQGEVPWRLSLLILLLLVSKATMDFTSSGLENPLSHLLVALFLLDLGRLSVQSRPVEERQLLRLTLLAAVGVLNRMDLVLLVAPPLAMLTWTRARHLGRGLVRVALLGTLPVTGWLLFSVVYYGFPFPNTYYAKLAAAGVGLQASLEMGAAYFANSLQWDPVTPLTLLVAGTVAVWRRNAATWSIVVGMAAYLGYVLLGGAAATHMSGRFFSVPFLVAALIVITAVPARAGMVVAALALVLTAVNDRAPVKFGTGLHAVDRSGRFVIDTKLAVYEEGAALLNAGAARTFPNHDWYRAGLRFRASPERVQAVWAPGYFGYAAGPDKWIIDSMGLCDPLLARLPGSPFGRGGHFVRSTPPGYERTVTEPGIHLEDPGLRAYYQILERITQGPLFTRQRFADILAINLGRYDHLLEPYARSVPMTPPLPPGSPRARR